MNTKLFFTLLLAALLSQAGLYSQSIFKQTANSGNIFFNYTKIDNAAANNNPNALLFVTADYGSNSVYLDKSLGVWYSSDGYWNIYTEDQSDMPSGAQFNVMVVQPSSKAFTHTVSAANIEGHISYIDNAMLNGNANARFLITANWGSSGIYNNNPVGVYYEALYEKWAIYNQNYATIPEDARYNILINDNIFVAENPSVSENWFAFSNPQTDNHPNAYVFATQYWTSVYNENNIGVWYNAGQWTIYNQEYTNPMPANAKFFVWAAQANDAACSAVTIPADGSVLSGFTNVNATAALGESALTPAGNSCATSWCEVTNTINNSVWFKFAAPGSGIVEISTCDIADFDTQIGVYQVADCSNFATYTLVAANDDGDGCGGYTSKFNLGGLTPGQTYYVLVDGYDGEAGTFSIQISPIATSAVTDIASETPVLSAYPNPVSEQLSIALPAHYTLDGYTLYDLAGRIVADVHTPNQGNTAKANMKSVPSGIYLLQVQSGNEVFVEKIVVE